MNVFAPWAAMGRIYRPPGICSSRQNPRVSSNKIDILGDNLLIASIEGRHIDVQMTSSDSFLLAF